MLNYSWDEKCKRCGAQHRTYHIHHLSASLSTSWNVLIHWADGSSISSDDLSDGIAIGFIVFIFGVVGLAIFLARRQKNE